jgi:hypothetical protein
MQLVTLKHITAESCEPVDGGVVSRETVADPPEICSSIATASDAPASVATFHVPTASHWDGPQHEIPFGPRLLPDGGATSAEVHWPPLKASMRASPLDSSPTAVQSVGSAQETDDMDACVPALKGSAICFQTPPLRISAIGSEGAPPSFPTATQEDPTQEIELSCGPDRPTKVPSIEVVQVAPFHTVAPSTTSPTTGSSPMLDS